MVRTEIVIHGDPTRDVMRYFGRTPRTGDMTVMLDDLRTVAPLPVDERRIKFMNRPVVLFDHQQNVIDAMQHDLTRVADEAMFAMSRRASRDFRLKLPHGWGKTR